MRVMEANESSGGGGREQKSLSLTSFLNLRHHSKIYCKTPPTEVESYRDSGWHHILASSQTPGRFSEKSQAQQRSNEC